MTCRIFASLQARPDCSNMQNPAACPRGTNPGRTHRFYTETAVVPFGFGLSYTTFTYSASVHATAVEVAATAAAADDDNDVRIVHGKSPTRRAFARATDASDTSSQMASIGGGAAAAITTTPTPTTATATATVAATAAGPGLLSTTVLLDAVRRLLEQTKRAGRSFVDSALVQATVREKDYPAGMSSNRDGGP